MGPALLGAEVQQQSEDSTPAVPSHEDRPLEQAVNRGERLPQSWREGRREVEGHRDDEQAERGPTRLGPTRLVRDHPSSTDKGEPTNGKV